MSTKIALFRKGELVQVAPPLELYDNPKNLYVADFIGNPSINFVKCKAKLSDAGMAVSGVLGNMLYHSLIGDVDDLIFQDGWLISDR